MLGVLCTNWFQDVVLEVGMAQLQPRDHIETGNADLEKNKFFERIFLSLISKAASQYEASP